MTQEPMPPVFTGPPPRNPGYRGVRSFTTSGLGALTGYSLVWGLLHSYWWLLVTAAAFLLAIGSVVDYERRKRRGDFGPYAPTWLDRFGRSGAS